jgi:hypothetical protein
MGSAVRFSARGQLPPRARAALSSCRLLAMAKSVVDGPDGVRPIAVAEVFQRLISRAIALQMRDAFQEYFSDPYSMQLRHRPAVRPLSEKFKLCWRLITSYLYYRWIWPMRSTRLPRGYLQRAPGSFSCSASFCSTLLRSLQLFAVQETGWHLGDSPLLPPSCLGSRWGDPLTLIYFCLALLRASLAIQTAHPDDHLPSFADATHIIGRSDAALAAFHHLAAHVGQLNLRVKLTKCVAYSPSLIPATIAIPADFIKPADGIRVLGAPIGSMAFEEQFVQERLNHHAPSLNRLPLLHDSQCAMLLLTRVFIQRPSYLMRTVPYSLSFFQQLSAINSRIRAVAQTIIGPIGFDSPAGSLARQQMLLPVSRGGLGLRSTACTLQLRAWLMVSCCQHSVLSFPYPFCCNFHGGGDRCPLLLVLLTSLQRFATCLSPTATTTFPPAWASHSASDAGASHGRDGGLPREPSPFGSRWLTQLDVRGFCRRRGSGLGLFWERCPSCSRCDLRMSVLERPFARGSGSRILPLLEFVGVSVARNCRRVRLGVAFAAVFTVR